MAPMPPSEPISEEASIGIRTILELRRRADCGHGFRVFLGDEVVDGLHVAGGDGFGHHLRCLGFGFGQTLAGFGIAEGGFALAFGLQDRRLLGTLGAQDLRIAGALGLQHLRALLALGLHLPGHGIDEILRRLDILDLDARDLDAPGADRLVDDAQAACH